MKNFRYTDIVTDRATGRTGTFIEYVAPCGAEPGTTGPEFALVEFGGEPGVPGTGTIEEVRV